MDILLVKTQLRNLLIYGTRAIKKRSMQTKESDLPDRTLETKIIKLFSEMLGEEYNRDTFKKQILKKKLPTRPSAKMVVKLLYQFIYKLEVDGMRMTLDDISDFYKRIDSLILKLNNRSRFFEFKKLLRIKVLELTKVKKQCFKQQSDDIENAQKVLKESIESIQKLNESDLEEINKLLNSLNECIAPITIFYNKSNIKQNIFLMDLKNFYTVFFTKIKNYKENKRYDENQEDTNDLINEILSNLRISKTYLGFNSEISSFLTSCINLLKELDYYTKNAKEKFLIREKVRENKAYSLESFEKVLSLNKKTLELANEFLSSNGFKSNVSDELILEYEKAAKEKNRKILDKSFFDKSVDDIKNTLHKTINQIRKSESMFGDKKPTSNQVLNKILDLF